MIEFDEGLVLGSRCTLGYAVGHIIAIDHSTYRVRWIDGSDTTQLRPSINDQDVGEAW
jgi:hypothetical protein